MKIAAGWFRERRGTALGIVVGAVGLGSALPHLLAWLGRRLLVADARSWRRRSWRSAGAAIVALGVKDGPHVSASAPFDRHALRVVLRSRGTRLAMLGYFGHMWELYAMWTWIAAFAAASLGAAAATGSAVAFVDDRDRRDRVRGRGLLGRSLGQGADRRGRDARQRGVRARLAGSSTARRSPCCSSSPSIWGFTVVADSAQFSALVTEHTPRTHVGTALTLQTSAGFLLTMVSMRLVPPLVALGGWQVGLRVSRSRPAARSARDEEVDS